MTRFAIDAPTALRIVRERVDVGEHSLVSTGALRSQAMQLLYDEVRAGALDEAEGRAQLEAVAALKVRLLGDRVSRSVAWRIAARLDWAEIGAAELLAVASLQADALVTDDERLAAAAEGVAPRMRWVDFASAIR
ncbi:hypothetical protein L332_04720 [Agrococcus pavilionensis RW1]|uniref:PIN domain-containing protein n=1 Tax=Agrococcus pavilionensis RW1 TaxID=1330458 RepID=U1LP61_9MICO|nr:hypothetical protein [Agrococcus pavilionensis]ERG63757.1 hypothetical protein L332_04720 [Agrococcus pavilionensis RW1]